MVAWLFWLGIAPTTSRSPAGVVRDRRRLLCIPTGQTTTCVFQRSGRTGRFLDVECCDLQDPQDEVACDKKCLVLMNDVARREPVASPV